MSDFLSASSVEPEEVYQQSRTIADWKCISSGDKSMLVLLSLTAVPLLIFNLIKLTDRWTTVKVQDKALNHSAIKLDLVKPDWSRNLQNLIKILIFKNYVDSVEGPEGTLVCYTLFLMCSVLYFANKDM